MSETSKHLRAAPDSFVLLFPVSWEPDNATTLEEVHRTHWREKASYHTVSSEGENRVSGVIELPDGVEARFVVESSHDNIAELAPRSKEPFGHSELIRLRDHSAMWRVMLKADAQDPVDSARNAAKIASTFIETGAVGCFMPALAALHSPKLIQTQTRDLTRPDALTNLFVDARDADGWMQTRGLTCFGWPELEIEVTEGLNAAYFHLMDVASSAIQRKGMFPPGSDLDVGPSRFHIEEGGMTPEDEQVPITGSFGVRILRSQ